jgi:hypothetical protein
MKLEGEKKLDRTRVREKDKTRDEREEKNGEIVVSELAAPVASSPSQHWTHWGRR